MENDPIFRGAEGFVHLGLYIKTGEIAEKEKVISGGWNRIEAWISR
jgi:hypothetical protein